MSNAATLRTLGAHASCIGISLLLAGCPVGPNFDRPAAPTQQTYDTPEHRADGGAETPSVSISLGADVPAQWWQLFKSASLDQTLRAAIADSPTLASAQATLAAAREAVVVARAGYLPRLSAVAGAQHSGTATAGATG